MAASAAVASAAVASAAVASAAIAAEDALPALAVCADELARCVLAAYDALPAKGKPAQNEWTVLAAFVLVDERPGARSPMRVLSLGTGTKCLSPSRVDAAGALVRDCHAEIVAKRALQHLLLQSVSAAHADASESVEHVSDALVPLEPCTGDEDEAAASGARWRLARRTRVVMFISQAPCGDACLFDCDTPQYDPRMAPARRAREDAGSAPKRAREDASSASDETAGSAPKRARRNDDACACASPNATATTPAADMQRTGARVVPGAGVDDPHGAGSAFHVRGPLRSKPGRGERTQSMACSDKIARWALLGCGGCECAAAALAPVRLSGIVIGELFDAAAARRALWTRVVRGLARERLPPGYAPQAPALATTAVRFGRSRAACAALFDAAPVPSGLALAWHCGGLSEVLQGGVGCLMGATRKTRADGRAESQLSPRRLLGKALQIVRAAAQKAGAPATTATTRQELAAAAAGARAYAAAKTVVHAVANELCNWNAWTRKDASQCSYAGAHTALP